MQSSGPTPAPRSAYIHVPFCARRCGYCNFTVVTGRDDLVAPYLNALSRELNWLESPQPVDTLYIGGGTPTHYKGATLARLLALVLHWHPPAAAHEFSIEANPCDLDEPTVAMLAEHGVTRVSLGAQSFDDGKLRKLERDHSPHDILRSVELVRSRGMHVSLDLIFAAPDESLLGWESDLRAAVELGPQHLSTYGLTIERGTSFWARRNRGETVALHEEIERSMYEAAIDVLSDRGFEHYEISNFARPGSRCRHNEGYWLGEEYFAAGAGAARYLDGVRSINHRSTTTYIKRVLAGSSPVAESERLLPHERALELLVFALRRTEGIARDWFFRKSGIELDGIVGDQVREFVDRGLICDEGSRIFLRREGMLVCDSICQAFLRTMKRGIAGAA